MAAPYYYLQTLGVHPDFQAQGYGRALLDAVHAGASHFGKSIKLLRKLEKII